MKQVIIVSLVSIGILFGVVVSLPSAEVQISEPPKVEVVETIEVTEPIETMVEVEVTEPQYNIVIDEKEVIALAKMAWGEARGCSDMEVAATMWCVLNRVDNSGDSIIEVITAPNQFTGYGKWCPVEDRFYNLAIGVLTRWQMEKQGASLEEVGRVLPPQYLYFHGDGKHNHFRDHYEHKKATYWDWSYPNPYETEGS